MRHLLSGWDVDCWRRVSSAWPMGGRGGGGERLGGRGPGEIGSQGRGLGGAMEISERGKRPLKEVPVDSDSFEVPLDD